MNGRIRHPWLYCVVPVTLVMYCDYAIVVSDTLTFTIGMVDVAECRMSNRASEQNIQFVECGGNRRINVYHILSII